MSQKNCLLSLMRYLVNLKNLKKENQKVFTAVCPGPNIAYFSKIVSLREMMDHIYGRANILSVANRPNMFIKELKLNVEYFIKDVQKNMFKPTEKQIAYLMEFKKNLLEGIAYYRKLFPAMIDQSEEFKQNALKELHFWQKRIEDIAGEYQHIFSSPVTPAPATV